MNKPNLTSQNWTRWNAPLTLVVKCSGKCLAVVWYHVKIDNLWIRPKPDFEQTERNHWQVGFCSREGFLLAGFYDHVIESETKLRNVSGQIQAQFWSDLVLALGQGYECLRGRTGHFEKERHAVLDVFGR